MMLSTILPPSSAGIGIKLKIPILMEIIAKKNKTFSRPFLAASLLALKIATGPPNLFKSGWKIKLFKAFENS